MMDWIFCKDRLPDKTGEYLVYRKFYCDSCWELSMDIVFYALDFDDLTSNGGWYCENPKDVIAWMPLPKAPKLEEV